MESRPRNDDLRIGKWRLGVGLAVVGLALIALGLFPTQRVPIAEADVGSITSGAFSDDGTTASVSGTWGNSTGGPCEDPHGDPRWSIGINWDTSDDGADPPTAVVSQEAIFPVDCSGSDPGPRPWGPETWLIADGYTPASACVTLYHAPEDNIQGNDIGATTCEAEVSPTGSITASKVCSEFDAGASFTFTLFDDVDTQIDEDSVGCDADVVFSDLPAGTYHVEETAVEAGWSMDSNDCQGLDPLGSNTCTVTNSPPAVAPDLASITIAKNVPGTNPQNFSFSDTIPGCAIGTLDDDPGSATPKSVTCDDLTSGTYTVSENVPADWELSAINCSGSGDADSDVNNEQVTITVAAGESVTCTFENDPVEPAPAPTSTPVSQVQSAQATPTATTPPAPTATPVEEVEEIIAVLPSAGTGGSQAGVSFNALALTGLLLAVSGGMLAWFYRRASS